MDISMHGVGFFAKFYTAISLERALWMIICGGLVIVTFQLHQSLPTLRMSYSRFTEEDQKNATDYFATTYEYIHTTLGTVNSIIKGVRLKLSTEGGRCLSDVSPS